MKLQDSIAIVTGGAQGVGRGIVEALLQGGAKVCIADRNQAQGEKTVGELAKKHGDKIFFKECDITKEEHIRAVFGAVQDTFGTTVDIMVNNAGIVQETDFSLCLAINLEAQIRCTYIAMDYMGIKNCGKSGTIIFTASVAGLAPFGELPVYVASKHGVVGFVRSIAVHTTYSKLGLRFNCVCPAFVDTDMITDESIRNKLKDTDAAESFISLKASGRILKPRDVGIGCVKLIEDDTLNGKALLINHGETRRDDVTYTFIEPQSLSP